MMSSRSSSWASTHLGYVGVVGLLSLVFIVLKLTGVITWSWLWVLVLAPLWASLTASLLILGGLGVALLVARRK